MRENIEKPHKYFLSDLMDIKGSGSFVKQANRDNKKLRKLLQPVLTLVYENQYSNNTDYESRFNKNITWVLKKIYNSFPREEKEAFLGSRVINISKENDILNEKFDLLLKEAQELNKSFRNFTMHNFKYVSKEDVLKQFCFEQVDGQLFSFFSQCAKAEISKLNNAKVKYGEKTKILKEIEYWKRVLSVNTNKMKEDRVSIPFIYILSSIAMFVDFKDMQEILNFMRFKSFICKFVLKFSVRINSKVTSVGFFEEDKTLNLYKAQVEKSVEIEDIKNKTNRRLLKNMSFFVDNKDDIVNKEECLSKYYQRLIWYYNFSRLYPKIEEFENDIRDAIATDIQDHRLRRIEEARQNNIKTGKKLPLPNLELDIDKIKMEQIHIYKNDDNHIFMREAMLFLQACRPDWFGSNWHISGNNVIWYEPSDLDSIEFDIRRKIKPSLNALNSIYKMKCDNSKDFKVIHLGYRNLLALTTAVILGNDVDFEKLKETAKISTKESNTKKRSIDNKKQYFESIKKNLKFWSNYKKISFIAKYLRGFFKKHLHLNESIEYHRDILLSLSRVDSNKTILEHVKEVFDKYGESLPNDFSNVLKSNNLDNIIDYCITSYASILKEKKGGQKTHKLSYTWKPYAFHPSKGMDSDIRLALGWRDDNRGDLFDLLNRFFTQNEMQAPNIASVYFKNRGAHFDVLKVLQTCKKYKELKREREIREKLSSEFLYTAIAFGYVDILKKSDSYMRIETSISIDKKIPTDFTIVFDIEPKKLKVSFEDYCKKDVRSIISWAFDVVRIGYDRWYNTNSDINKAIDKLSDREKASKALNALLKTNEVLSENEVLKTKAPKYYMSSRDYFDIDDLKALVKRSIWVQKELLFLISGTEKHLTWILEKNNIDYKFKDREYYYNFHSLIDTFRDISKNSNEIIVGYKTHITADTEPKKFYLPVIKKIDVLPTEISIARSMLVSGALVIGEISSEDIIRIIELTNKILFRKSIAKVYENRIIPRTNTYNNRNYSSGSYNNGAGRTGGNFNR